MLPKLQQSSLAQNLRRDNPATLIQGIKSFIQLKTSWKISSARPITSHTSLGRIIMPQKILILPSEIFPRSTCQRPSCRKKPTLPITSKLCQDLWTSMSVIGATEESPHLQYKKGNPSKTLLLKVEPYKKEKFLLQTFAGIMIVAIYPSESIINPLNLN